MATGKRRRGRRARRRGNAAAPGTTRRSAALGFHALSRALRLEQLEDRRLLATFEVVNVGDIEDPDNDGTFEIVAGSLRDALTRANEFDDFDTIVFTGLAFEQPTAIGLQRAMDDFGQIEIAGPVEIIGPGASKLEIFAANSRRIFLIDDGAEDVLAGVTISGVTLGGRGTIPGDDEEGRGGIILNRERLTLAGVELTGGNAPNGGGGIFNEAGLLTVDRSLVHGNTSGQGGGGIQNGLADQNDNLPRATIVNSTITGNRALGNPGEMGAATGYGGGILNFAGTVNIDQSTVYGNTSVNYGGGVSSQGFDPEIDEESGMATVYSGNATTNIHSSIIAGNTSSAMGEPMPDDVGSIGVIAGDMGADPPTEDTPFDPQINSLGYNLFGTLTHPPMTSNMDVTLPPNGPGDSDGVDPTSIFIDNGNLLNPVAVLGDYGGDTRVYLPDPSKAGGLLAIDGGDPMSVSGSFDQRGRHFRRVFPDMGVVDIGAAEVQDGLFVVDTLVDETDGEYRDEDFSLREAIAFSEKNPNRDTISFSQVIRQQDDPNPFTPAPTIVLSLGELAITKGVDIQGPTFQLEVDGNLASRIFRVDAGGNSVDVKISDLTLFDGGGVVNGGAIFNNEDLTLNRMYLRNSSASLNGGALYVQGGNVTVDSSTFLANNASNNGGAIFVDALAGTVEIINSTLSANTSANRGAGLANLGTATVVKHSTVTLNNAASTRASGVANLSGGLLTVYSSIIAGNLNSDIEFFGGVITDITSTGYNLVGVGNAAGVFSGAVAGDTAGVLDPKLAALAFTGGPTPTHRVLGDSLALDGGELGAGGLPMFDQRGGTQFVRVFDGNLDGTAQIDIGSYELQEVTYTVDSANDENDGNTSPGNLSLREAVNIANASISPLPETIIFDALLTGAIISLLPNVVDSTPDIPITGPLNIIGPGITISGSALGGLPMFTVDDKDDQLSVPVSFDELNFVNGSGRAIVSSEDVTLDSITATQNRGVVAHSLGTLTINNSTLTGNDSPDVGGAIAVTNGNLVVAGAATGYGYTLITGNRTNYTGGHGGGISFSDSTSAGHSLALTKVIVSGNEAPAGEADGAGLYISGNGSAIPGSLTTATVQDSVISGNVTTGSNSEGSGVFSKNTDLTLTGTIVSLNESLGTNSRGGGIYLSGGSLTIENSDDNNSLVTQNTTAGNYASGGGIANIGGDVTLNQVTISRNQTFGAGTHGAGIYSTGGNLTLNGTTVTQNSSAVAGFNGGGIYSLTNLTGEQQTSIFNSTISGNTASLRGGGVYNAGGDLEIRYSTITDNNVPYYGNGGGVASRAAASSTRTTVGSSIIAGNHSTFPATPQLPNPPSDVEAVAGITNSFVSLGYNVIGNGLPLALDAFEETGDQSHVLDPGLGPLTFNGGPTATHALLPTSRAINAGDPDAVAGSGDVPLYDQRGMPFTRVDIGRIDVGAFESDLSPIQSSAAADFDDDGDVDGADFLAWQRGAGLTSGASRSDGDANLDGAVDGDDVAIWETDFGTGIGGGGLAAASSGAGAESLLAAAVAGEPLAGADVFLSSVVAAGPLAAGPLATDQLTTGQLPTGLTLAPVVVSSRGAAAERETTEPAEPIAAARDRLFADYAPPAVSQSDEGIDADYAAAAAAADEELEFTVEDLIFDLLGA